jgi:3-oxoacyl-[acyl-carrier-protein] synthase-1
MGMINALGPDAATIWRGVLAGDGSHFAPRPELTAGGSWLVGAVADAWLPAIPSALAEYDCRNNAFTLASFEQIEAPVRDAIRAAGPERVGVVMGTSTSGSSAFEAQVLKGGAGAARLPEFRYAQLELGGTAGFLAELLDLHGPAFSVSTACSSSARALVSARSLLALGLCDVVLAGGADSLCALTTHGFASLKAVAQGVTNPFSRNRDGLTVGEGAALFLVTREAGGIQLLGAGESSEAHHISSPDPEGLGALASMRGALRDAGAAPGDVAYLNLHGTGTRLNDAMESRAVAEVFGTALPCSSTKSLVGHCLGAAGAIELAFCWQALRERDAGRLPLIPHCWDGEADPELAPIRLAGRGESVAAEGPCLLMSNSFGFGGNNCTLLIGAAAA